VSFTCLATLFADEPLPFAVLSRAFFIGIFISTFDNRETAITLVLVARPTGQSLV